MRHLFTKTFATFAAVGLLASASPAAATSPDWAQKNDLFIVEAAVAVSGTPFEFDSNGDDFDILVAAVVATGYFIDPLNGEDDYTVFAPLDSAFVGLVEAVLGGPLEDGNLNGSVEDEAVNILVALLGLDGIRAVLDYHVTEGVRNSRSVTGAKKVTMLDGNVITAQDGYIEAFGSDADFVDVDNRFLDGIIHIISAVLLPPL